MGKVVVSPNLKKERVIIVGGQRYSIPARKNVKDFIREVSTGKHRDKAKPIS